MFYVLYIPSLLLSPQGKPLEINYGENPKINTKIRLQNLNSGKRRYPQHYTTVVVAADHLPAGHTGDGGWEGETRASRRVRNRGGKGGESKRSPGRRWRSPPLSLPLPLPPPPGSRARSAERSGLRPLRRRRRRLRLGQRRRASERVRRWRAPPACETRRGEERRRARETRRFERRETRRSGRFACELSGVVQVPLECRRRRRVDSFWSLDVFSPSLAETMQLMQPECGHFTVSSLRFARCLSLLTSNEIRILGIIVEVYCLRLPYHEK